jgi:hypothetical protein
MLGTLFVLDGDGTSRAYVALAIEELREANAGSTDPEAFPRRYIIFVTNHEQASFSLAVPGLLVGGRAFSFFHL